MSTFKGMPRAMRTDDFDLPLPLECDDEYWAWEEQAKTDHENSDQDFKQPADRPSRMSYWVVFLKLLGIVAFAQGTLYTVQKTNVWTRMGMTEMEWNENIVGELDSALNAWIGTVPAHLKWNPNRVHYPGYNPKKSNPFFEQSTILYVNYWAQIIVHKPFLTTTPSPVPSSAATKGQAPGWRFPSIAICTNAARSAVRLVEIAQRRDSELQQGRDCRFPLSFIMSAVISSATTLFVNVWRARGTTNQSTSNTFQDLGDVYRCFEILRRWEHVSQVSGRFCDILNGMLSAYGLPSSSSMESYFTRGTRRGRDENDGEETSDAHNDSSGETQNPNLTRLIAAHPRPIAGPGRVYSSNLAVPNSSVAEPRGGEECSAPGPDTVHQVYDSERQSYVLGQAQNSSPHDSHVARYHHISLPVSSEELVRKDQRFWGPHPAIWTHVITATKPRVGLVEEETQ
ncbi:Gypsy retrotransposon integrase-like protein 1 [Marasmius tenuissimus]|uniref:Gypsy retrotransposon integrase-like protein 1 n=1 Tax=Marasmius tenuissimus TaxID=585030 RepID=A0ABR2ZKR0_9AGAR